MIYNFGEEHFSNPSPVKRVNVFFWLLSIFFPIFLETATTERVSSEGVIF